MGRKTVFLLSASLVLMTLLSGCTFQQGPGGQSASVGGSLNYQGSSTGSHSSQSVSCDDDGKVNANYQLGGGSMTVKVTDGAGATIFSQTYTAPSQGSDSQDLQGSAGGWTITVTRGGSSGFGGYGSSGGGFSGQYSVNLAC